MPQALRLVPCDSLFPVLSLLRSAGQMTRPELAHRTGLTRKVVVQRVDELIAGGLAEEGKMGASTGGRAPREVKFRTSGANVLVAELAATSITVGLTDLAGTILNEVEVTADPASGPDATLARIEQLFDDLLAARPEAGPPMWGIGIGVPGPVAIATGRPVGALSIPGWADYPVRDRLAARYDVPVWVDNEANLMALGEFRAGLGRGHQDVLFIKIGSGIGSAIISSGTLNRGSQGFAGEIGHVFVSTDVQGTCWCGQTGCLTQVAGARALASRGRQAARDGRSPILAAIKAEGRNIGAREIFTAASAGDSTSIQLLTQAGQLLGEVTSVLVSALNPSMILIGGGLVSIDDPLMTAFHTAVRGRSLPNATSDLHIAPSPLGNSAGLIGAAYTVVDELLSPERLGLWSEHGTPVGLADLIHQGTTTPAA
jgi:glucokinase-like ROK family protein